MEGEGDKIKSKQACKRDRTLTKSQMGFHEDFEPIKSPGAPPADLTLHDYV